MSIDPASSPPAAWRRGLPWLGLLLVLAMTTGVRLRLAAAPLERDEGEYAYNAQLLLRHLPPYRYAYNMKFPGVYGMYALIIALLGQTPAAIRAGVAAVNAADTLLVFLMARRLWGKHEWLATVAAAATFALLSLDERSLGWVGHAEHFELLPALAGLLLLLPSRGSAGVATLTVALPAWRWLAAGVLLGVAILMKQPAVALAVCGGVFGVMGWKRSAAAGGWKSGPISRLAVFGAAVAAPVALLMGGLWWAEVFSRFWFWTVDYARSYGSEIPMRAVFLIFGYTVRELVRCSWPLWGLALVGFIVAVRPRGFWQRRSAAPLLALGCCSFAATAAGELFRNHYFILMMPAAGLSVGALFCGDAKMGPLSRCERPLMVIFLMAVAWFAIAERRFLFLMTPVQAARNMYRSEAFVEAVDVGRYLRANTQASDTVAVFGSEPEIYFYAERLSATGYIYTYPLLEPQPYALAMQQQMAQEVERARPAYVVWVHVDNSWMQAQDVAPPRFIFDWWQQYRRGYVLVAATDLEAPAEQRVLRERLGSAEAGQISSGKALLVYRRRG